jgi:hypothetical protein
MFPALNLLHGRNTMIATGATTTRATLTRQRRPEDLLVRLWIGTVILIIQTQAPTPAGVPAILLHTLLPVRVVLMAAALGVPVVLVPVAALLVDRTAQVVAPEAEADNHFQTYNS